MVVYENTFLKFSADFSVKRTAKNTVSETVIIKLITDQSEVRALPTM